jgi:exodeoxyribonuclease VII small subunit
MSEDQQEIGEQAPVIGEEAETIGEEPRGISEEAAAIGEEPRVISEEAETIGDEPRRISEEAEAIGEEPRVFSHGEAIGEEPQSYEAASARVEEIVRRLDSGQAGLRETLELVREGRSLIEFCARELDAVGGDLEELQLDELVARLERDHGGSAA